MKLNLYGTEGCHLCDDAEILIRDSISEDIDLVLVDIIDDDDLYEKYQFSIPVLENVSSGAILNWPFTADDVLKLI